MSADGPPVRDTPPPGASGSYLEAPSLIGETLDGRYRILRKLGEGGMGEVYAAEHIHIEKRFAIKLLRQEIVSNPEAVQRFRQEARSSSSIGHRNIIAIEDFGQLPDGRIYMCMELLNGAALNDLIQQPQPLDRLLNILIQTGHGLAAAHAKGIVHRDMKPENIFVTIDANNQDVPKLLDFGIAKVAGNDSQNNLTRTGTIFGTPFYMAPEQALGNPVDARTDVYAMGVIMYEVFAGSLPFQGESFMGILTQHITTEPEPVAQRAAKAGRPLPPGLADIVACCMQKDPAQRFASMDDLVGALVQIYRGIAGPGMSTYMEAFPVSARMPAPTPPPLTGAVPIPPAHAATVTPHGYGQPAPSGQGTPVGPSGSYPMPSGPYSPSSSQVIVPKKSKAGIIIAVLAVLAVGGGVAAFVVLSDKPKNDPGAGSQVASGAGSNLVASNGSDDVAGSSEDAGSDTGSAGSSAAGGSDLGSNDVSAGSDDPGVGSDTASPPVDAGVEAPPAVPVLLFAKNGITFEVYEDGKRLFEGPDSLPVTPGSPRKITIKAKGFKDKVVVVDGKKKKLQFRLVRAGGHAPGPGSDPPPPAVNCSAKIVDPTSKACIAQFCGKHPDNHLCGLE
jgi:serine/threonine protein kinase